MNRSTLSMFINIIDMIWMDRNKVNFYKIDIPATEAINKVMQNRSNFYQNINRQRKDQQNSRRSQGHKNIKDKKKEDENNNNYQSNQKGKIIQSQIGRNTNHKIV